MPTPRQLVGTACLEEGWQVSPKEDWHLSKHRVFGGAWLSQRSCPCPLAPPKRQSPEEETKSGMGSSALPLGRGHASAADGGSLGVDQRLFHKALHGESERGSGAERRRLTVAPALPSPWNAAHLVLPDGHGVHGVPCLQPGAVHTLCTHFAGSLERAGHGWKQ